MAAKDNKGTGSANRRLPVMAQQMGTKAVENLPALLTRLEKRLGLPEGGGAGPRGDELPNATVIYGVGSAALFGFGVYTLFAGSIWTALFLFVPAGALLGFALHYLRYPM